MTETNELRRRAAIGKTVRRNWAEMGDEERARRSAALKEKKQDWWGGLSAERIADLQRKMADGRRSSEKWIAAHQQIASTKYRNAGWPEDEIEFVLTLGTTERQVARMRMHLYGVGPLAFRRMIEAQDGRCGICQEPLKGKIHLDHNHTTGAVRGLLCPACNLIAGQVEARSQEWLERALIWIGRPWAKSDPEVG